MDDEATACALIIDDAKNLRLLLEHFLERENIETTGLENGRQAFDYIEDHKPPDIVLVDLFLPYKNGFEIIKEIKKTPEWENTPIIMISSSDSGDSVEKALELGANDYIEKPFDTKKSLARIKRFF